MGDGAALPLLNPISFADIDAYSRMTGVAIREWELRAILRMDAVRLAALSPPDEKQLPEARAGMLGR